MSYDLDRDGYVGGKDYVVAKQFDKDGDGRLNEEEKKAAYEAIAKVNFLLMLMVVKGYEKNFVWNVEVQGGNRPYRLM
jgi:hypothetical protein